MTHQNHQTNGASLEDCHTNFFALTDLCGIKWRKLILGERTNTPFDPLDDPVLSSYSKCLAKDILCVWRRVASQPKNDLDQSGVGGMFDISLGGSGGTLTHPPLSLTSAKEMWIFWYGEEPDLTDLVSPELLKSSEGGEQGSWESGLSYECRSLLFKALHNLIERCLLSRDIVRLGKWFVQPTSERNAKSSVHLSFSFAFFVHGDSTVCASMDIRKHPPVQPVTLEFLSQALQQQSQMDSGDANQRAKSVILAPYGISGILTGQSYQNVDQQTQKILNDWGAFYPLLPIPTQDDGMRGDENVPPVVEVIAGGVKMRYPSKYVLLTDVDDKCSEINKLASLEIEKQPGSVLNPTVQPHFRLSSMTSASILPERAYQDAVMNAPAPTGDTQSTQIKDSSNSNNENSINAANGVSWDFNDPVHKVTCSCIKCSSKRTAATNRNSSQSGSSQQAGTSGSKPSSRMEKGSRIGRMPFHKRSQPVATHHSQANSDTPYFSASNSSLAQSTMTPLNPDNNRYSTGSHFCGPSSQLESQQMSVGSPASISASPMHQNISSVHSQPSSVPVNEHMSPNPPMSTNPGSVSSPMTPSENNLQRSIATPGDHPDKNSMNSPLATTSKMNRVQQVQSTDMKNNLLADKTKKETLQAASKTLSLKRPLLNSKDYENITDEDYVPHQLLYDYSTWDAWLNHPIKRYKACDSEKYQIINKNYQVDLYAGQTYSQSSTLPCILNQQTASMREENLRTQGDGDSLVEQYDLKNNALGDPEGDKMLNESLYTSEGLQVSFEDLNKIFDNSDDNSNDGLINVHTPPGSNKSNAGCATESDSKRNVANNYGSTSSNNGSNNPNTTGLIRNEDLSKMFPTPPSLEQHPNSSPCGGSSGNALENMENIPNETVVRIKQEPFPLGSPQAEPIDDWSYVFIPPKTATFPSSTKYDPLTNLSSQILPPNLTYKPSWLKQKEQDAIKKSKQTQPTEQNNVSTNVSKPPNQRAVKPQPPFRMASPQTGVKPNMFMDKIKLEPGTYIKNQVCSPSVSNSSNSPYPGAMHHQFGINNVRSPMISPMVKGNMLAAQLEAHSQPPPPYDVAIHSPNSLSFSANRNQRMLIPTPLHSANMYNNNNNTQPQYLGHKTPEANSLLVNLLLYDTSLNIFRDHNFDSCTICVCNAGPKCVGNIRGSDSGIYLSLTASCHFNENLLSVIESSERSLEVAQTSGEVTNRFKIFNNVLYSNSPSSSMSSASSPCNNGNGQNQNGYLDEDPISCRCGFSAVVNRRLAHKTGLFYEDELEITGMAEDPAVHKKSSLLSIFKNVVGGSEDIKTENGVSGNSNNGNVNAPVTVNGIKIKEEITDNLQALVPKNTVGESTVPLAIMDLLREQCSTMKNSSNSIQRAVSHYDSMKPKQIATNHVNILEFIDAFDVITLAIEQSRLVQDKMDNFNTVSKPFNKKQKSQSKQLVSAHKWPYLYADGPKSNQDIVRIMKSMQPLLQDAFHKKCTTRLWDAPYTVKGPLTWREFHRLAGRGTGQCEPQPIPSVIVGHEKDWLSVAPYALHYWDKLLLEPYSYPRDIAYIVVAPDSDFIVSKVKNFFKELSTSYEMCRLGRHQPVKGWDGILRIGKATKISPVDQQQQFLEEWLQMLGNSKISELIRMYGAAFRNKLIPYLSKIPQDKTLLDPPESYSANNMPREARASMPSPMPPPESSTPGLNTDKVPEDRKRDAPGTPKSLDQDSENRDSLNTSTNMITESLSESYQEANPPHIVLYLVEPFTSGTDSVDLERLACLALLKCYSNILNSIPESIRNNISVQIISQESVLELGRNRDLLRCSDHMRSLALNVFSQSRRFLTHTNSVKSLTGFGTAAMAEQFMKTKDEKNKAPYRLITPAFILSTQHEKSESAENFGQTSIEEQCSIMYCSYCLSEDQSWLLATATDERGEFLETCTINIDVPNRIRRRKASARRVGLQKLMDFLLGVISQSVQPWRLVIGRIGRIGHGELKGWSWLLSKQNLLKASKHLKDICQQCSLMYPHAVPSILSACLVTLEPDSSFRVMPDQFTPDERFSQLSMQSPLSTPQDVTCSHILVFPTSAITQSSQTAFQEQHINVLEFEDDIFHLPDDDGGDVEDINGIEALFENWNEVAPQASPPQHSRLGSPTGMDDNRSRHSPGLNDGQNGQSRNQLAEATEEVGQLLQQPLALGYLVSTAPTGRMPSWFWSSCPHLENVCPVFLKTALHLHSPAIHQNDDIFQQQQTSSANDHPLDSTITADVLRYVLEGYNVLSWLTMDSNTHDRLSCLPIHVQMLMQLYQMTSAMA